MDKKRKNQGQREEFEELQRRKRKKLESPSDRRKDMNNPAKSTPYDRRRKSNISSEKAGGYTRRQTQKSSGRGTKQRKNVRKIGMIFVAIQAIVSLLFVGMLYTAGMVPMKYMAVVIVLLAFLCVVTLLTQLRKKGRAVGGKVLSGFLIITLSVGTFYIGKANGALGQISGGSYKIDKMVVSVLKEDPAETLSDAADYTFGVQYQVGKADMETAIQTITEEIGHEIKLTEYNNIQEQAKALQDKEVDAIIYNEGYTDSISESFEGYEGSVRIIYEHKIKKTMTGMAKDADVKKPFSVYISGIDVYGDISQTSRSDVNIIAVVNPETHQILLVTTPRDYFVPLPGVSGGANDKLTHAGNYGVDVSMATLEELYQIEIPFFVRINFTSMIEIVDQLGGVDVYSEYEFSTYPRWGDKVIQVQQGMNHFNGEEALLFSRERKNLPGGDNQRGKNQQAVITAMIKKMISPALLVQASGIIDSVSGNVETNMSQNQMQELIKEQLNKGGSWNIYSVAAEGTGGNDYCFSSPGQELYVTYPDENSVANIQDLINRVEGGEVLEGSEVAE